MPSGLDHAELADALRTLGLGVNASELHGSLCGYLCAGAVAGADDWLDALELGFGEAGLARNAILQRLYRSCRAQAGASPAAIEPLLPAATAGLPQRADALVEWCRGFLGGFGLGGTTQRAPLSADASGILADLGVIAATQFDDADAADDEQALADVIAFVRAGSALLRRETHANARLSARSLH